MIAPEPDPRLQQIESALAHLERGFDTLNQVVIEQGRRIRQLEKLVEKIRDALEQQELDRIRQQNPPPPHHGR